MICNLHLITGEVGHFSNVGHLCFFFFSLNYLYLCQASSCLTSDISSLPFSALFNRGSDPCRLCFPGSFDTWVLSVFSRGRYWQEIGGQKEGRSWVFLPLFLHQGVYPAGAASPPCLQLPPKTPAMVPAFSR